MVMAATYMLQMFDLIYITTNGGPGKTTTNLPLLLYSVFKSENNYEMCIRDRSGTGRGSC